MPSVYGYTLPTVHFSKYSVFLCIVGLAYELKNMYQILLLLYNDVKLNTSFEDQPFNELIAFFYNCFIVRIIGSYGI